MYTYAWYHWLTFFYLYCFFGWIFESSYVSARKRRFVNRGFLRLPMLPLYGTGAVMMLWVSIPVKDNLVLVWISGFFAATLLEYVTGWTMERLFKVRYWDYSDQRFNVNGYICLSSSVAWGFLTILMTEVIHRPIEEFVLGLSLPLECTLLVLVSALFIDDVIHSTKEALDLAAALEAATRLRGELDDIQVQLALLKAEVSEHLEENMQNLQESLELAHQEIKAARLEAAESRREKLEGFAEAYQQAIDAHQESRELRREELDMRIALLNQSLSEKREALRSRMESRRFTILNRNPSAVSRRFAEAMKELRDTIENKA